MNSKLTTLCAAGALLASGLQFAAAAEPASKSERLRFVKGAKGDFTFDTGVLRGTLRADGKSHGLSSVIHVPTGLRLDRSMGLLSHYRVFTTNRRYGTAAWDWPSEAALTPEGGVQVRWPGAPDRPFELQAVYRLTAPNQVDLETVVVARTNLSNFESFIASYFTECFTNALVCAGTAQSGSVEDGFIRAESKHGVWLTFPRDRKAEELFRDGRWAIAPNPVDWVLMPPLRRPLGIRRCPSAGVTVALMSPPKDCIAVSTPFETEPHYSTYLSLFGRDLRTGETARGRVRIAVLAPGAEPAAAEKLAREFE